jgi:hypothetical protein
VYSARYLSDVDGDGYCAEVSIYPVGARDGSFGVESRVTIGEATRDEPEALWRPDDCADIEYEWASDLAYETLDSAQEAADRLGQEDWKQYLYLRPQYDYDHLEDA